MTIQGLSATERFAATSFDVLNRFGVRLTMGHDFEEYRALLAEGRPDHILGAPFDPDIHSLHERNAIWVVGHDARLRDWIWIWNARDSVPDRGPSISKAVCAITARFGWVARPVNSAALGCLEFWGVLRS